MSEPQSQLGDVVPHETRRSFPIGWVLSTLEEACVVIQGQSPPGTTYNTNGLGLPFLQGKAEFTDLYPKAVKWCSAPSKIAEPDDVLISIRAPVGPTNLCAVQSCIGRGLAAIRTQGDMPAKYILYAMRATEEDLRANSTGTTFEAIRGNDLRSHPFPLPPLAEQNRIVAEIEKQFTRLNASVAVLKRVLANLKRYRASVLKAACEGRLVPTEAKLARSEGRDYEPADQLLERILAERRARREAQEKPRGRYKEPDAPDNSDLPGLPNGWVWTTLPQLGELNRGKSKHRPRNDPRLLGGSYPFVQTGDIRHSQGLVTRHSQTYTEFGLAQSRLWPSGTLCITIAANIAETGILSYPACFPDSVVGFVCYDDPVISKFLEFFVRTEREGLERFAPATAQKNLNLKVLSDLAVPLPPLAEQHRLVAEVERLLSVINQTETTVEANLTRAERLRQSILKEAFSGKLVPQDPNDEPASVLLQRIRAEREAAQAAAKPKSGAKRRRARSSPERQLVLGVQEKTS